MTLVKTGRSTDLNENVSGIANNYRFNCDKKKGGKKNPEKRELPGDVSRKFVDIVVTVNSGRIGATPSPIYWLSIDHSNSRCGIQSVRNPFTVHTRETKQFLRRRQSFARVSNFRLFAGFVVPSRDRYFRKWRLNVSFSFFLFFFLWRISESRDPRKGLSESFDIPPWNQKCLNSMVLILILWNSKFERFTRGLYSSNSSKI